MSRIGFGVGIIALALAAVLGLAGGDSSRFFQAYLVNYLFFLTLALGGFFFVIVNHIAGSTWSVVVRRLAEAVSTNLWLMALLFIPVVAGMGQLYEWTHAEVVASDPILSGKRPYLNTTFFLIRAVIYFAVWCGFAEWFSRQSRRQDQTGEVGITVRMERVSAPVIVLFALTVTFASFDWVMSLNPHWYSTIYGVYFFAGSMFGFFALLPLVVLFCQRIGRLRNEITPEHYHDLGKWMFCFVVFWAYIGFSQYMLIWYANIPEETVWFAARQNGGWGKISVLMILAHFFIPFFGLLPRTVKRTPVTLFFWGIWMLVMHWFDLFWQTMPHASPDRIPWNVLDLLCFLGIGGLFVGVAALRMKGASLLPVRDPRLPDSLAFENV
jgi:hypothetical protein